jgi:hypothetical protein
MTHPEACVHEGTGALESCAANGGVCLAAPPPPSAPTGVVAALSRPVPLLSSWRP